MNLVEMTALQFVVGRLGVADVIVPEIDGMDVSDKCDICYMDKG